MHHAEAVSAVRPAPAGSGLRLRRSFARGLGVLRAEAAAQAGQAFVWCVAAFAAGIVAYFAWPTEPAPWTGMLAACLGAGLFLAGRTRGLPAAAALCVLFMGLGHAAAQLRTWSVATPLLETEIGPEVLTGMVTETERRPGISRVVLAPDAIPGLARDRLPRLIRLSIPQSHGLPAAGQSIRLRAVVGPARPPAVPGGFQFQRFLYFKGIGGVGYSVGRWEAMPGGAPSPWRRFSAGIENLRHVIGARVAAVVPGDDGTVATALINGEQSLIPDDLQEAYRVTGLAHLLSISGVHMSLLAGLVFFAVRRALALFPAVALRRDTKKIAAWAGLAATGFYLLISGMSVPAVRSFLMIAVVMVAVLLDRTALSLRSIAWAALALMALFPEAVTGASFQMSFAAVLAIIALYERLHLRVSLRAPDGRIRLLRAAAVYVAGIALTDLVAGSATSLFAAYHFNRVPAYSMAANFVAVPVTGLWIMPAAMTGLILMPFGLDGVPLRIMGEGVALVNGMTRSIAAWPGAEVHVPPMAAGAVAAAALGVVVLCLWQGRLRWLGAGLIAAGLAQPWLAAAPDFIVDETARVIAVTDAAGRIALKPGRTGRFIRDVWRERFGPSDIPWPETGETETLGGLRCDGGGCRLSRNGRSLAVAFGDAALAEDCGRVDVIVSLVSTAGLCRAGTVIDRRGLAMHGAAAIWLHEDGIDVLTSAQTTGDRAWSPWPRELRAGGAGAASTGATAPPGGPAP